MAHFLEHLVFKGGEKYDDYRKVNETAERMGGIAERLHEPRPRRLPHHGARRGGDGGRRPADGLRGPPEDRRRGARPRARRRHPGDRALRRPALRRRREADRPRRVRRPPAGPHGARSRPSTCATPSRATASSPSASAAGRAPGGAFVVGNVDHVPADGAVAELFERFPDLPAPEPYEPAPRASTRDVMVEQRDSNQSHLRMSYRPDYDVDRPRPARRDDDLLDAARRLDGLAPVRRDPRAARPLLLRLRRRPRLRRRRRSCSSRPGWTPARPGRPTRGCARSSAELRRRRPHRGGGPARAGLRRRRAASWPSRTRTPSPATARRSRSSSARTSTPTRRSPRSTR